MKKIVGAIDSASEWLGVASRVLVVALFLVGVLEVTLRYVFIRPTMWGHETFIMIAAASYVLSWACVHKHDAHIRKDIIYAKLSAKGKALTDMVCALLFFVPVIGALLYTSADWMLFAWETSERSELTFWFPPLAPLRTIIFIGMLMFALQGVAQFIRDFMMFTKGKSL